jgi:hydroxymethylglutaryl-CoA lyase
VLKQVAALGADEVALSDTIGVALPEMVRSVVGEFRKHFPLERTALHLHATYGLGTASALAGHDEGIRLFDGSTGGIGGCPYAKGATGNVATEDLAYAFHRRGAFPSFKPGAVAEALDVLKNKMGMKPQGNIAGILERGGEIYGVQ